MSDLDYDAIQARIDAAADASRKAGDARDDAADCGVFGVPVNAWHFDRVDASARDVPALLAKVRELEAESEPLLRDRDDDHAWNHRCAEADIRCVNCNLRYGERDQFACHSADHYYSATALAEARRCDDNCPPWSRYHDAVRGSDV